MLGVKTYDPSYVDSCRAQLDAQLKAYDRVATTAAPAALEPFAACLFANLVIVLDAFFVHRVRAVEGKDGNPLNEVRMLADSVMHNDSVLMANSTIKYRADDSVLGYAIGDTIAIDRDNLERLADRYFAELRHRFT
jgi:hypothetical protein